MLGIEIVPKGRGKEVQKLGRLALREGQRMVYPEFIQCWHRPEHQRRRRTKHRVIYLEYGGLAVNMRSCQCCAWSSRAHGLRYVRFYVVN